MKRELSNLLVGVFLIVMSIVIILVGYKAGKKINPFHVIIYFMSFFVLLTGVLLLFAIDKPSVFGF